MGLQKFKSSAQLVMVLVNGALLKANVQDVKAQEKMLLNVRCVQVVAILLTTLYKKTVGFAKALVM